MEEEGTEGLSIEMKNDWMNQRLCFKIYVRSELSASKGMEG